MTSSTRIADKMFRVNCADALAHQADWLLETLRKVEDQRGPGFLKDGVKLEVGWSTLTVKETGDHYMICEPDFARDPFHDIHDDLTCTLSVQAEQNTFLRRLRAEGLPARFHEKVVLAKDCLNERRLFLERKAPSPGDSGWYIGPADESGKPHEYEAVLVFQLLRLRPSLLNALGLPVGYLVVFDGDRVECVLDDQNRQLVPKEAGKKGDRGKRGT